MKSHGSDKVQVSNTTDGGKVRVSVIHTTTTTQKDQGEQEEQDNEDNEGEEAEEEPEEVDLQVRQWVAEGCNGVKYWGEVISFDINPVQVNVTHKIESCWKWPQSTNMISYQQQGSP